ncbi:hypothetical protein FDN13_06845 [Caloramator sp. E03]|uniref:Ig-like domain-containing protein n=1 Tax=Caloramator sp. E03 TaxID=2576307 RepID=UPI001110DC3E|nr:Ig-like domain-containing protein [Caloramator sp. E03]QCX33452.1 hypothetical protein FDN13_06845 [Caloramator sp. E03]
MAKAKKVLSTVLVALFTVFTVLSYVPAQSAKAATAGPKINMVAQPNAEYKVGDRVLVKFNSGSYKGIVQYRAFLWKVGYGKVKELYPDYAKDSYFYKPVCVGTSTFTIDVFYATEPGVYEIVVGVKAKGAKASTASYVTTSRFTVKAKEEATIKEIAPLSDVRVEQGNTALLPATVKATYSDGTTKEVAVTWPAVDTTKTGFVKVEGTIAGTTLKPVVNVLVVAKALNVESVSVVDASTLKVVGDALDQLKTENITIADNAVTAVKPAADLKSAEVTLENKLAPNSETVIKIGDKEFKVTYGFVVSTVSVVSATFDDDTAGQKVGLKVNGADVDYDYLAAAGYTVEFNAFDSDGINANDSLFDDTTNGTLLDDLSAVTGKDFKVQVTITKGSTVLVSDYATIKIRNLDNTASSISEYTIHNNTLGADQNSTTLVVDETATISKIKVTSGSSKTSVTSGIEVKSSNPGVVSVDSTTYEMTAEAPGTATITITYGDLTKTFTMTVSAKARKVAKVAPDKSTLKMVTGKSATMDLTVTDQYGDPFAADGTDDVKVVFPSKFTDYVPSVSGTNSHDIIANPYLASDSDGSETLTFDASGATADHGSGTIYFKDADGKIIGSLVVSVTEIDNVAKKVIEIYSDSESDDNNLDKNDADDDTVTYRIAQYNSNGVYNGNLDLTGFTAKYNSDVVNVTFDDPSDDLITVTAVDEGTTDVAIYNAEGDYVGKVTVKVVNGSVKITGVQWKNPGLINYATTVKATKVLDIVDYATDDVVKGITLSESTVHKIRITSDAKIYIDKNDDGSYASDADTLLGTLIIKKSKDSTIASDSTDPLAGISVIKGEKGTIIFSILNNDGEVISSTSVKVDVK